MDIHICNFAANVVEEELKALFITYGKVESLKIIKNNHTGMSRGFGFVSMPNEREALQAIFNLNNFLFQHKKLVVSKAGLRPSYRKII